MSIRRRLASLERSLGERGCGPDCPPRPVTVVYKNNFYDRIRGGPEEQKPQEPEPPAPCPRCGRAAEPTVLEIAYVSDFYHRLDGLTSDRAEELANEAQRSR